MYVQIILRMYRYKVELTYWKEGNSGDLGGLRIMEVEIATVENGQWLCLKLNA